MTRDRPGAVVLLSGGMDSATTLALALERGFEARAMTVDYGQSQRAEIEKAREQAAGQGVATHRIVRLDLAHLSGSALTDPSTPVPRGRSAGEIARGIPTTYVPARNLLFLSLALGWAEVLGARDLFIGANAVDFSGYPDCRGEFLRAFEGVAAAGTRAGVEGRPFRVHAPLLDLSKAEIVREAVRLKVDLARTLSCYAPGPQVRPCGECDACALRARGFREAGISDPGA